MRSDGAGFADVAARLAHQIAASAIWWDRRCTWVGALPRDDVRLSGRAEAAALGPDLYGGTSGVALFLAEAAAHFGDARLRATALGAIRHALDHADRIDPPLRDGLYLGMPGIAYASVRVARLHEAADVAARARELLELWRGAPPGARSPDVMSGCAGAVVGLAALHPLVPRASWLLDVAAQLGDALIARARVTAAGRSWGDPRQPAFRDPCGYAHGAAGVGHALAELFAATGEARFRAAATGAFDYERSWLDPVGGTWPDLRGVGRRAARDAPCPASDFWCSGSSGIALSRLRASELFASGHVRRDADIALTACARHVEDLLTTVPDDCSLCHGATGVAHPLLAADAGGRDLPTGLGRHIAELYDAGGPPRFPCGVPLGETPGLLLGTSGIGLFYLRLAGVPGTSPLLVTPTG